MNKARLLILGLALGSAGVAAMLAKGVLGKKPQTEVVEVNRAPMVEVLVASKDMALGERLSDSNVNWRSWPQDNISAAMITREEIGRAHV